MTLGDFKMALTARQEVWLRSVSDYQNCKQGTFDQHGRHLTADEYADGVLEHFDKRWPKSKYLWNQVKHK